MVHDVRREQPDAILEPADPTQILREGLADETLGSDLIGDAVQRYPQDLGVLERDRQCSSTQARPPCCLETTADEATKGVSRALGQARVDAKPAVLL